MLKENDVILLKFGMRVFTDIPAICLTLDEPYSEKEKKHLVTVGYDYTSHNDVKEIRETLKVQIEKYLWEVPGLKYEPDIVKRFVNYVLPVPDQVKWRLPEGEYLVLHADQDHYGVNNVMAIRHTDDPEQTKIYVGFTQGSAMPGNIDDVKVLRNLFLS